MTRMVSSCSPWIVAFFPENVVRLQHPLEKPSCLDSAIDLRRVRAFVMSALEEASLNGHTLLPKDKVVEDIAGRPVRPACQLTGDVLSSRVAEMSQEIAAVEMSGGLAVQLNRYKAIGEEIRKQVDGRLRGKRHVVADNWSALLTKKFGPCH